jgi:hypothetical protein
MNIFFYALFSLKHIGIQKNVSEIVVSGIQLRIQCYRIIEGGTREWVLGGVLSEKGKVILTLSLSRLSLLSLSCPSLVPLIPLSSLSHPSLIPGIQGIFILGKKGSETFGKW